VNPISKQLYSSIPFELQDHPLSEKLRVATRLAILAAEAIKSAYVRVKQVDFKGEIDLVTDTDKANERLIFEGLRATFPEDKFIGEESSSENGCIAELTDSPTWIVDPIDGTTNFVHNFPASVVSIAFSVGKEICVGVVADPSKNEIFQVLKGKGAFLNGIRQTTSTTTKMNKAIVIQEFGYDRTPAGIRKMLFVSEGLLLEGVQALRQMGSGVLDLVYVACGRADAVYTGIAGENWKPWDFAAGSLFASECGCVLSTVDGRPFHIFESSMVCACSKELLTSIVSICRKTLASS